MIHRINQQPSTEAIDENTEVVLEVCKTFGGVQAFEGIIYFVGNCSDAGPISDGGLEDGVDPWDVVLSNGHNKVFEVVLLSGERHQASCEI